MQARERLIVTTRGELRYCLKRVYDRRDRIELSGMRGFRESFRVTFLRRQKLSMHNVSKSEVRIQFDRAFRFPFRPGPVPIEPQVNESHRDVRFRQRVIDLDRLCRRHFGLR